MPRIYHWRISKKSMSLKKKLPGFPNAQQASAHNLKFTHKWTEDKLKWLDKNWVRIGTENGMGLYVRPDVMRRMFMNLNKSV